jgi:predicted dehydrogenase
LTNRESMKGPLQVGIIGANAERGWARISHVPAVQKLNDLELAAVVSGNQNNADAAAKAFGARAAYGKAADLFRDTHIDIVTVAVKVPDHRELVLDALKAGKHVYCEWPLGRNLDEAEELSEAAKSAGVHCAIGLQTRFNPVLQHTRSLLSSGVIGRILTARILSTTMAFGENIEKAMDFAEDAANGVTLVTVQGAHTIDFVIAVLGRLDDLTALATTQFPEVRIAGALQHRATPDHLLIQCRLEFGSALGIEVAGGRSAKSTPFNLQIVGDNGELVLEGGAPRGFQSGKLQVLLNGQVQEVNEGELAGMPENAFNVAGVYAALRDDIRSGSRTVPDFEHAVRLTSLIEDVLASSQESARKSSSGWPQK